MMISVLISLVPDVIMLHEYVKLYRSDGCVTCRDAGIDQNNQYVKHYKSDGCVTCRGAGIDQNNQKPWLNLSCFRTAIKFSTI